MSEKNSTVDSTVKRYVLGFAFNRELNRVVLIRKNRPDWMRGRLNGVGGKIEKSDYNKYRAMQREFREECGVDTQYWYPFALFEGSDGFYSVDCFYSILPDFAGVKTMTDEQVEIHEVSNLYVGRKDLMKNLPALVNLAINRIEDGDNAEILRTW